MAYSLDSSMPPSQQVYKRAATKSPAGKKLKLTNVCRDKPNFFTTNSSSFLVDPLPRAPVKKRATAPINLTLTLDDGNASTSSIARRRVPWTLSESLALWHEVQLALPTGQPPSWAKIWHKVFSQSRRSNVDLKDRWRVIQNSQSLQAEIRQAYGKWLDSKKRRGTDS